LLFLVMSGCSTRDHDNPLDPANPSTGGHPRWLEALADDQAVDLLWEVPFYQDVDEVRLVEAVSESVLWRGPIGSQVFRDENLTNGEERSYRLELDLSTGSLTRLPVEFATPGPAIPWVYDLGSANVARLTPDGRRVRLRVSDSSTNSVVANPQDGSALVINFFSDEILTLDRDGNELWSNRNMNRPVAGLWTPEGWWVSDAGSGAVLLFDGAGTLLWSDSTATRPFGLAVGDTTGEVWVADRTGPVFRIQRGIGVTAADTLVTPFVVSEVGDGGVWVADDGTGLLTRLDADANRVQEVPGFPGAEDLGGDPPSDGTWVADRTASRVVLIDGQGNTVVSVPGFPAPSSLSVAPDGSEIWVADVALGTVVRLARSGEEISRTENLSSAVSVSVAFDPQP
jgi:streptogramin lyase